jgi:hypothetical protein
MNSSKKKVNELNLDSYLSSLGYQFPITDNDLKNFQENHSDFKHELSGNEIDPQKIIDEVAKEEAQKQVKKVEKKPQNLYFKRIVLAGEITRQLFNDNNFGHIKLQKIIYLCEKVTALDTEDRYSKQAAGPCDNKLMHTIDNHFKRLKWFDVKQEGSYNKYIYQPMENIEKANIYFNNYFKNEKEKILKLIDIFRESKAAHVELIATVFACLNELFINNEEFNENKLIEKFYNWSDRKSKFKRHEISTALQWMRNIKLTPDSIANFSG